jgi:hypothetical protein
MESKVVRAHERTEQIGCAAVIDGREAGCAATMGHPRTSFWKRCYLPPTTRTVIAASILVAATLRPDAFCQAGGKEVAQKMVLTVFTAVNSYLTEYGRWPSVVEQIDRDSYPKADITVGDLKLGAKFPNSALFNVIRSIPETSNIRNANNPRRIVFLEVNRVADPARPRSGFLDKDGDPALRGCLFDPWGREYLIALDYDGSGSVKGPNGENVKAGVIIWSAGPDGESGTEDDIRSWQPDEKTNAQPAP